MIDRLCNACRHWHYVGKGKRSDCRRMPPVDGVYPEMKGLQTCNEWEVFATPQPRGDCMTDDFPADWREQMSNHDMLCALIVATRSIAGSLEKIASPLFTTDTGGVVRRVQEFTDALPACGPTSPVWTFPREWHVEADRIVLGGIRESGPA